MLDVIYEGQSYKQIHKIKVVHFYFMFKEKKNSFSSMSIQGVLLCVPCLKQLTTIKTLLLFKLLGMKTTFTNEYPMTLQSVICLRTEAHFHFTDQI